MSDATASGVDCIDTKQSRQAAALLSSDGLAKDMNWAKTGVAACVVRK